ncbi:MAG: 2-C-methyl-D-erythritol 4-phosphate cytidylyltransferase [Clostridiaceae bacterium]|nr:2-C-methyl-D-erythritol 4-phosphate cytidylyltransferase [Clostridiaceae bacterium]
MNTALIFAGGSGIRMNVKAKPKQFLELNGRAIIIHTLEYFENHPEIDSICIVIIESWIDYLKELLERYSIKKVKWVVAGGITGQESIFNGLQAIYKDCDHPEDCVVLIHDGVRPLINDTLISDNIASVRKFGSAITVSPVIETIVTANENNQIQSVTDRKLCMHARAPQSFILKDIYTAHLKAIDENIHDMIDSASLMKYYRYKLYTVDGPVENIKITTPMDYYLFRAIYEARENSQIFGI